MGARYPLASESGGMMALLKVQGLCMKFGGLQANWDVTFQLDSGEMVGLIGPNGAGKSTLFNCVAGVYTPTHGKVFFKDRDVTGFKAFQMARLGLARTFQVYAAVGDLNVLENITVGGFLRTGSRSEATKKARELVNKFGLQAVAGEAVANLPIAAQKRVAMATALATDPDLLLLDEVAAGLNPSEIEEMISVIRWIHSDLKKTVFIIEHVMELVMKLSHRVLVLDSGNLIAEGRPVAGCAQSGGYKGLSGRTLCESEVYLRAV